MLASTDNHKKGHYDIPSLTGLWRINLGITPLYMLPLCILLSIVLLCAPRLSWAAPDNDEYQVLGNVAIHQGRLHYFGYYGKVFTHNRFKNTGNNILTGQFRLVVENPSQRVLQADGTTANGEPYFWLGQGRRINVEPGEILRKRLFFSRHRNRGRQISYNLRVEYRQNTQDQYTPVSAINFAQQQRYYRWSPRGIVTTNRLSNQSTQGQTGPFRLVISNNNRPVQNADGYTHTGEPFIELTQTELAPGEQINYLPIIFNGFYGQQFDLRYSLRLEQRAKIITENTPPLANAGPDQAIAIESRVTLDASASSDADGDTLSYNWRFVEQPQNSAAALSDLAQTNPNFIVDQPGAYVLDLIVNDGSQDSEVDQVIVSTVNIAPVANAGSNQQGNVGDRILLDASASSDRDGDILQYQWQIESAPQDSTSVLETQDGVISALTIDNLGEYVIRLNVTDPQTASATDTITITSENLAPVANAGPDQQAFVNDIVQLDASASVDVESLPLSYRWAIVSQPEASQAILSDSTLVNPTLTIDSAGDYLIQLIVNDTLEDSTPDQVIISTINSRPIANAGPDQSVAFEQPVVITGIDSNDVDGDSLSYQWAILSRPEDSESTLNTTTEDTTGLLPDQPGLYVVQLVVSDGQLSSTAVTVNITVQEPPNESPRFISSPVTEATVGQNYSYSPIALDSDSDPLTYNLLAAPAGMVVVGSTLNWLPDTVGDAAVILQVSDDRGGSATQRFSINVKLPQRPPEIDTSPITLGAINNEYLYAISASDINRDDLDFSLSEGPLGMRLVQSNNNNALITWRPIRDGSFPVVVTVTDQQGFSTTQAYSIQVAGEQALSPTLDTIGNRLAPLGQTLTIQLSASDPQGAGLQFGVSPTPLPRNMTLNAQTGEFEFIPERNQVGSFNLTFSASNGTYSAQQSITITVPEPDGVTRLRGQVLTLGNAPLAGVRLEIGDQSTFTNAAGDFLFDGLNISGDTRLLIDGSAVDPTLGDFATVPEIINLVPNADNVLTPAVFLIPLDTPSADTVVPTRTSIVDSSIFDDVGGTPVAPVTLTIPAGAGISDVTGLPFSGDITISRVPDPSLGPRPLPEEYDFSVYIAIQPFGVTYPEPVPISFPNVENFAPGTRQDFFALNHETGEMEKIGEGLVSADGRTVDSIGGVVRSNSWHGIVPQGPVVEQEDTPDTSSPEKKDDTCEACRINKTTGNLGEWHSIPSYRSLAQQRTFKVEYNSNTTKPSPILTLTSGFGNQAPPPISMSAQINVDGIRLSEEVFTATRIVPSAIRGQFELTRPAIQYDASNFSTGLHSYELMTQCYFPISRRADTINGEVMINNQTDSAIGAGWAIAGLQRLYPHQPTGKVLLADGTETLLSFEPVVTNPDQFNSPPTDYSVLRRNPDGTYSRRMKDGMVYEYDSRGLLTRERDRNNNTSSYQYDSDDRLISITDPVGEAFELSYSASKLSSVSDPLGRTTRFEHDSLGNLIAIIEPNGDTRTFEYAQGDHLMLAQTDQRDNRKQYRFDFARRILEAILPDDSKLIFGIGDINGLINPAGGNGSRNEPLAAPPLVSEVQNTLIDQNGNESSTEVDANDIPIRRTDAVGRSYSYQRDINGEITNNTRPNGSEIDNSFDALGNMLTRRENFNGALYRYSYDGFSLMTSYTNPNNHTTTYERDASGNATSIVNALGHTITMEYDSRGLVTRMETPNQLIVEYSYNDQGLVESITQTPATEGAEAIRVSIYSYDAAGQNTQLITPDNITLVMSYDDKGRITRVVDNLNQTIDYRYDGYNNLIQTDTHNTSGNLALTVQSAFDNRNRAIEASAPHVEAENSISQTVLDNNSNIVGNIDPNGSRSSNEYDSEDRLIRNTHRLNGITEYNYDTNDRIIRVVAPNGVATGYTYDLLGRITSEISPDRGTLSYSYDNNNNMLTSTDGRGITTTYSYDELERPVTKTFPNTAGTLEDVSYCYDNASNCAGIIGAQQGATTSSCELSTGRLCAIQDESGTYVYNYDSFGNQLQMIKTELGASYTTAYEYDQGDNITRMRYPTGRIISINRDGVRRVQGINAMLNGVNQTVINNIQYRADNQQTRATFGNGLTDTRSYDLQGRLTDQRLGSVDERSYNYDRNSNMLSRTTTPQNSFYDYDALDRLVGDQIDVQPRAQYEYDLNHNRQSRTADTQVDDYDYQFGSNRLLTTEIVRDSDAPAPAEAIRSYNNANRWYQLFEDGELTASYTYNAQGLRTRKVIGNEAATATVTIYHYDQQGMLIAETDSAGSAQREYIYNGMSPVAQIDSELSETINYLHTDHLYTPRFATNNAETITWRWEGDAFGTAQAEDITTVVNLRFPGQYFDEETQLHYNHFRYYDPQTGRYVQSDRIGLGDGTNTYGYGHQNPLIYMDPQGLAGRGGGQGKGERGRTGKPTGTNNPWKKMKPHPTDPNKVIYKDANGKKIVKPKPPGFPGQGGFIRPGFLGGIPAIIILSLLPNNIACAELDCDGDGFEDYSGLPLNPPADSSGCEQ